MWVAGWLCWALAGCATIGPKADPRVEDRPLRADKAEVPRATGWHADLEQDGSRISVAAVRACDVVTRPVVKRTTTTHYENQGLSSWVPAGAGLALAGAGVATLLYAR